jgi:hypothetical protein
MKRCDFWDVTPCGSLKTYVSEELSAFTIRVTTDARNMRRLLAAASVVPSSPILVTLMKKELGSA